MWNCGKKEREREKEGEKEEKARGGGVERREKKVRVSLLIYFKL